MTTKGQTDKTVKQGKKYTSDNIETLRFPESIRKSPGMYIGGTDGYARWITVKELLDNALDEALAGRNKSVWLDLGNDDGTITVIDQGNGVPQGTKTFELNLNGKVIKNKMPTMQAVFGELHTSGKFRDDAYAVSVGTHGVGAKATNATAEFFEVITFYEGKWYTIEFKRGKLTTPVGAAKAPKAPDGTVLKKGTLIRFRHDPEIFGKAKGIQSSFIKEWGEIMAYLTPGFAVKVTAKGKEVASYHSKNGPRDYIDARVTKLGVAQEQKLLEYTSPLADVVVAFTDHPECDLRGYTNGSYNREGGKHLDAVTGALYKALLADAKIKVPKPKKGERSKAPFLESDVKEGLVGLVNAKLHKAQFNSQDKVKLADDRMGADFEAMLTKDFIKFFDANKAMAQRLRDRALALNALKSKFVASKKVVSALNALKTKGMPAKYAPAAPGTKPEDRELLLVEGDSAGGGIRKAKGMFPYMSLLPLKGKILNTIRATNDEGLDSDEVLFILSAIGYNPKAPNPIEKLQVGKIICVADPDPDGCHINSLLLALFYKYLPELFERGMIYVAETPEFYARYKDNLVTGNSLSETQKKLKKLNAPASVDVKHIKGWGEIDIPILKLLVMNPETRKLVQIKAIETADRTDFVSLMNEDVAFRRNMLNLPMSEAQKKREAAKADRAASRGKAKAEVDKAISKASKGSKGDAKAVKKKKKVKRTEKATAKAKD